MLAQVGVERHQDARGAEAALERVVLVEGGLQRPGARPSIVRTSQPSAWTASVRHERTGSPSSCTVQAPHTPCSQPTFVPVSPRRGG